MKRIGFERLHVWNLCCDSCSSSRFSISFEFLLRLMKISSDYRIEMHFFLSIFSLEFKEIQLLASLRALHIFHSLLEVRSQCFFPLEFNLLSQIFKFFRIKTCSFNLSVVKEFINRSITFMEHYILQNVCEVFVRSKDSASWLTCDIG